MARQRKSCGKSKGQGSDQSRQLTLEQLLERLDRDYASIPEPSVEERRKLSQSLIALHP